MSFILVRPRRPVILGMCDPTYDDPSLALSPKFPGSAGRRLWQMSGMSLKEWEDSFIRMNLLNQKEWDRKMARDKADGLRKIFEDDDRLVICLGSKVWDAFRLPRRPWFFLHDRYIKFPHPSGRNLFYNKEHSRRKAASVLRKILREAADRSR